METGLTKGVTLSRKFKIKKEKLISNFMISMAMRLSRINKLDNK